MEELLKFFKDENVAIQITIEVRGLPTVHAFDRNNYNKFLVTEGDTVFKALKKMKIELFKEREIL